MSPLTVNLFQQRFARSINKADPAEIDIKFFRWRGGAQLPPAMLEREDGLSG